MKTLNLYFYPLTTKFNPATKNPYTINFIQVLRDHFNILNEKDASSVGIMKSLKYLFRIDVLLLNWIEELPDKRGGYFQSLYFVLLVFYLKLKNKKVVWIMHNKLSHHPGNYFMKKLLFRFILVQSDIIITHASEGIHFARSLSGTSHADVRYFPHPVIPTTITSYPGKEYDVLIWGSLAPYKSIDKFLQFLYENHLEKCYKIKVVGKITTDEYRDVLMHFQNEAIQIEDCFVEREALEDFVAKAKTVLFPYSDESLLCSGAVIDTLSMRATIIGPNTGNFRDLYELGLIYVYNDYKELIHLLDTMNSNSGIPAQQSLDTYFEETSWKRFANVLKEWINEKK
jgi:beta-1,4-mannosyltransferase